MCQSTASTIHSTDVIYVSTIHINHVELSLASIKAGKNVLCEKPMSLTLEGCQKVLAAAKEKNVFFAEVNSSDSLSLLISLSLGETLLLEAFDGKVYDLLPVFLPELLSYPSNHLCLAPIFWLVFLSLSFRLS